MNPKFKPKEFLKKFPPDTFDYSESYKEIIEYITDVEQHAYHSGYYKRDREIKKSRPNLEDLRK